MKWVLAFKRTEDPKLAFFESLLTERGIPHRRNGHSFHAPILEVPEEHEAAAWAMLGEKLPRRRTRLDDMPDDHEAFAGFEPHDWLG